MRKITFIAGETHFADHLRPVWDALKRRERGGFVTDAHLPSFNDDLYVVASWGDLERCRNRDVVMFEHGTGQTYDTPHRSYAGGPGRENVLGFAVPNEHVAAKYARHYPGVPCEVVGIPRMDSWADYTPPPTDVPVVAVSFHWDCTVAKETRSAWFEYREAVIKLSQQPWCAVLGHGHPRIVNQLSKTYDEWGIQWTRNFDDVLRYANVYAVDNSSTLFEFAATGRPVVVLDSPEYRKNVEHGLRFWKYADIGPRARDGRDLIPCVKAAIADPPGAVVQRERMARAVVPYVGTATKRAIDFVRLVRDGVLHPADTRVADALRLTNCEHCGREMRESVLLSHIRRDHG